MNGSNKLECLWLADLSRLVKCNTLACWAPSHVTKKIKYCDPRVLIYKISFTLYLTNDPNKLKCFITVSWEGFGGSNTLAYWVHVNIVGATTFSITALNIITLSITAIRITTLSIIKNKTRHSAWLYLQHNGRSSLCWVSNAECHFAECRYAESAISFIIRLDVMMLSIVKPHSLFRWFMLSIVLLSVIMLSVIMPNVMAPHGQLISMIRAGCL